MTQSPAIPSHTRYLVQQLMRDIAERGLEAGDRLGTENDLIERYDQTRAVVRQALGVLEQHGIVSRRQRLGTFIERRIDPEQAVHPFRGSIVLAIADDHGDATPDSNLARYVHLHATLDALNDMGFTTQTVSLRDQGDRDEQLFAAAMRTADLEGVVFIGSAPGRALLRLIPSGVPVASANLNTEQRCSVMVVDDAYSRIRLLTDYLIDLGHRDIAVICGSGLDSAGVAQVMGGYREAMESHDLPFRRQRVATGYDDEPMTELALQMLTETPRPTALIADGPMLCHAALHAAAHLNLRIGEELSLVGRGQNVVQIPTDIKLTAYIPDYASLGRDIARSLRRIIDHEAEPPLTVRHDGRLVEGNSVKNLKSR